MRRVAVAAPGDAARRPLARQLGALLRWRWLVPGSWLVGMTAAALLVYMPAADGPPGVVVGALSLVLGVVLVTSVGVMALGLAAGAIGRVVAGAGQRRRSHTQERRS